LDLGCEPAGGCDAECAVRLLAAEVVPEALAATCACFLGFNGLLLGALSGSAEACAPAFTAKAEAHTSERAQVAPSQRTFRVPRKSRSFNAKASTGRQSAHTKSPTGVWHCNHPRLRMAMPAPVGASPGLRKCTGHKDRAVLPRRTTRAY
jgi:hypothetical protein